MVSTASQWPKSGEKMVISYLDEKGESNGDKCNLFGSIRVGTDIDYDNATDKLKWLQSQILGVNAEFQSPFGRRLVTYSDFTASGRFLRFVVDWLEMDALPFYGEIFIT
ncbi:Cysteine desulfurase [Cinnamomum micranthum f. kanehirae]|uniref:Cysteine desulfurase n=1 Tax=Cinnamomum micranthum f. kanehirae TaxID=337451 RepID=A0A3S3Q6B9_9MAGN|nr:Cysteine desulfurase [Cinnamomum micranthum f. kanehirae]